MAEQEELRLTVNLADNASAGLSKLNEEIKQLGSGAGQQHIEKFKRDTADLTTKVKGMSAEVGEAFKGLGMLRSGLALGGAGMALFGYELIKGTKLIVEYANQIRALNQAARQIGVNPGQYKDVLEQLKAFGIDGGKAASSLANISEKIADLQRRGSQVAQELRKNAGPDKESQANMEAYIQRLKTAQSEAQTLNTIREGGLQVEANAIKNGATEMEAADRKRRFWAIQGYDAALQFAGKLNELSKDEQRIATERQADAVKLANAAGQITQKWETLIEEMKQPFVSPVLGVLTGINSALDSIIDKVRAFNERRDIRTKEEKEKGVELSPEADYQRRQRLNENRMRELRGAPPLPIEEKDKTDAIKKNTSATEELTNLLKLTAAGGGGAAAGGGIIPAAYHPDGGGPFGPRGGGGGGGFRSGGGYSLMPNGQTAGPGSGAGAGSTPAAGGGGGAPSGPATAGVGAARGRVSASDDPRGMAPYIRETAAKYGIDPDTAVAVAKSEGLANFQSTARTKSGAREESWGALQLYTGGGLGNEFQKQTGLDPRDPKNEKATIDFALKHASQKGWGAFHGAKNTGISKWAGINGQTAGAGTGAGAGGAMAGGSVPKPVMDEAKALLIRGGGSGELQQFMASKGYPRSGAWCGQFTASVVTEAGGKPPRNAAVASNWLIWGEHVDPGDVREGDVAVRTRSRYGGAAMPGQTGSHVGLVGGVGDKTIDMVGGNQGRPVASRNRWSGEWEFRRAQADRAQIDQAQAASTKVEGTGKISVNVNAPKGTNVGAEGGGLFKKVEISRQTQMSEAPRGPKGGHATSEALQ
jgi:hypothetical protein